MMFLQHIYSACSLLDVQYFAVVKLSGECLLACDAITCASESALVFCISRASTKRLCFHACTGKKPSESFCFQHVHECMIVY